MNAFFLLLYNFFHNQTYFLLFILLVTIFCFVFLLRDALFHSLSLSIFFLYLMMRKIIKFLYISFLFSLRLRLMVIKRKRESMCVREKRKIIKNKRKRSVHSKYIKQRLKMYICMFGSKVELKCRNYLKMKISKKRIFCCCN